MVHRDGSKGRACAVEAAGAVDALPAETSEGQRAHKLLGNHRTVSTAPTASLFLSIEILRYDWAAVEHVDGPRQVERCAVPGRELPGDAWRRLMSLWLVERGGRSDVKWRAIRPQEGQHSVVPTNDGESAFVHGAMMAAAQQHEIVEVRDAAVGPAGVPSARGVRVGVE